MALHQAVSIHPALIDRRPSLSRGSWGQDGAQDGNLQRGKRSAEEDGQALESSVSTHR